MAYTKTQWVNGQAPAISATNLNKIENELESLDTGLSNKLDVNKVVNQHSTSETEVYSANYVNEKTDYYKLYNNSNNQRLTEITLSDNYTNYKLIIVEVKMFDDYQNITIYSDQIGSGKCYLGDFSSSVNNRRISIGLKQNNKVYINFDDSNEGIIKAVYGQFKN